MLRPNGKEDEAALPRWRWGEAVCASARPMRAPIDDCGPFRWPRPTFQGRSTDRRRVPGSPSRRLTLQATYDDAAPREFERVLDLRRRELAEAGVADLSCPHVSAIIVSSSGVFGSERWHW
jgi:hypothetical protein